MAVPRLNCICITQWPLAIWAWLWRDSAPGPSLFKLNQYWRFGDMLYNTTNVFHLEPMDSEASFSHYSTKQYPLPYMTGSQTHSPGIKQSTLICFELKRSKAFLPRQLRHWPQLKRQITISKGFGIIYISSGNNLWIEIPVTIAFWLSANAGAYEIVIIENGLRFIFCLCRGLDSCTFSHGINPIKMPFLLLQNTKTLYLCQRNYTLK